nr:esterase B1-like [Onthophagus taurus]
MESVEIKINQGVLKGNVSKDFLGTNFFSFQGIPYAKPPIGNLRFQLPEKWESWEGVKNATQTKPGCYSVDFFSGNITGSEDCLYLNVYTPEITTNLKPVMVFIHAGAFLAGSGSTILYGPEYLISQNIVLVTLNYRVGALGFLSLEPDLPGNVGLMDQIMALKWVRENISDFGGNPRNITLFGHSAGAASVHYLLLSPKSEGLFHKAIIQSGSALDPWARGHENSQKLIKALGINVKNNQEALKILKEVPVDDILMAQLSIKDSLIPNLRRPFSPIIQQKSTPNAFLTEDPLKIILEGNYNKNIPIIFGYTSREGILFDFMYKEAKQYDLETAIPHFMNIEKGSPLSLKISEKIKKFYFEGDDFKIGGDKLYQLQTDNLFLRGIYQSAKHHAKVNKNSVYLYRFSMETELNTMRMLFKKDNVGACHGDDVFHVFKNSISLNCVERGSKEFDGVLKMVRLWSNFAKFGEPKMDDLINVEWKPIDGEMNYLDINVDLKQGVFPEKSRMEFWDEILSIKSCSRLNNMENPIIHLEEGKIRGKFVRGWKNIKFYSFQAIPYAEPPIGKLRFKAPIPKKKWSDIKDCTKEGEECYSRHLFKQNIVGSEDCLILNVYTKDLPNEKNTSLKPVMVWIHGGAFITGSSKTDLHGPDYLVNEDVVIVTINYRLGLLGFLSFEDPNLDIPGNAGFKDQVLALKWVQKNIKKFGGDPNNVTIFGVSAGASSTHNLILSPITKGLFHKAIMQSASALLPWSVTKSPSKTLMDQLGFKSEKDLYEKLQGLPVEEIFKIQEKMGDHFDAYRPREIGLVIEKSTNKEDNFMPEHPLEIIKKGSYNKVPMILGYCTREGMFYASLEKKRKIKLLITNFEDAIPNYLNIPRGSQKSKEIGEKIKKFYYADEEPSQENKDKFYLLTTDIFFFYGIYKAMKLHALKSNPPVYFYRFDLETKLNIYKKSTGCTLPGTSHADDIAYLFKTDYITEDDIQETSIEEISSKKIVKMWTSFAKTGDPNPKDYSINAKWIPVEENSINYLNISETFSVKVNPEEDRIKLWDEIHSS